MGDDNGDDPWEGEDFGGSAAFSACEQCGGRVITRSSGEASCIDCGLQSQDVRQLTHEVDGRGFQDFSRSRGKRVTRRAAIVGPPLADQAFNTADFLRSVQTVLRAQVRDLVRSGAAPAVVFPRTVGILWTRYLTRWITSPLPPALIVDGQLCLPHQQRYLAVAVSRGLSPPPHASLTPTALLSLLLLAARILRLPLRAADLAKGAAKGDITFLDARSALSAEAWVLNTAAEEWFSPPEPPRAANVERGAIVLSWNLCAAPLPPRNIPLAATVVAHALNLPKPVSAIVSAIAALETHDSVNRHRKVGWCGVAHAKDGIDDGRDDAATAALVIVSMRLIDGWEKWVDINLRPGICGSSSHDTTLRVDASAADLVTASTADLTKHVAFVTRGALSGGDIIRGRASEGYSDKTKFLARRRVVPHDAGVIAKLLPTSAAEIALARARDAHEELIADGGGDASLIALLMGSAGGGTAPDTGATKAAVVDDDEAEGNGGVEVSLGRRTQARCYDRASRGGGAYLWPQEVLSDVSATAVALADIAKAAAEKKEKEEDVSEPPVRYAIEALHFMGATTWRPMWPIVEMPRQRWGGQIEGGWHYKTGLRAKPSARDQALLELLAHDAETTVDAILEHLYYYEVLLLAYTPIETPEITEAPTRKRSKIRAEGDDNIEEVGGGDGGGGAGACKLADLNIEQIKNTDGTFDL